MSLAQPMHITTYSPQELYAAHEIDVQGTVAYVYQTDDRKAIIHEIDGVEWVVEIFAAKAPHHEQKTFGSSLRRALIYVTNELMD